MRKIVKNILAVLTTKEKQHFLRLTVLDIVVSILDIVFLASLLLIIQFYIQPDPGSKISFLPDWLRDQHSAWLIGIFLLLFSLKNTAAFYLSRAHFNFINGVACRISARNLSNYQQAPFSEFVYTDSSVYLRNICYQPFEFAQYMLAGMQQLITQISLMLVTLLAIIIFNVKIFLLLLVLLLPPVLLVFWLIKKRMSSTKKSIQQNNELSFRYVLDALKGYVESNIYNRNHFFLNRFLKARSLFSKALFDSLALQSLPGRIIEIIAVLGLCILVIITGWLGSNNNMLLTIGAFMAAAYKLIPGMVKVINTSGQMKTYELSLDNLERANSAGSEGSLQAPVEELRTVEMKNLHFTYNGMPVLENFSMSINPGDFIGMIGRSGQGKTTVINILLGFLQAGSGDICINGKPVKGDAVKQYWPGIAYLRQQSFLINDTITRNITLEETVHDSENLETAMRLSGIEELLQSFPEGKEKVITENGKNISGGQQQRIGIARALYKNARLILLDEPFNELDAASTALLLKHFKELTDSGKAVLMITHDQNSLAYCNKIISLDA